jgi:mono/diheme cytochrome c family protein
MLNKLTILFIITFAFAKHNWFITNLEYGKMLYNNPRGISCAKCHGKNAKGKIVTFYFKKGKKIYIKTPNIQNIDLNTLKQALFHKNHPKNPIMPIYNYLTNEEIEAILLYLRSKK